MFCVVINNRESCDLSIKHLFCSTNFSFKCRKYFETLNLWPTHSFEVNVVRQQVLQTFAQSFRPFRPAEDIQCARSHLKIFLSFLANFLHPNVLTFSEATTTCRDIFLFSEISLRTPMCASINFIIY